MLADYGPRSEGGAGAVARSRSLRNARSKLDKKRLAFVVVLDDFSLERRSCGPEQISGSFYVETSNHRSLLLNITKEFYEYYANHTINLSPPSDLVGRWTTTVGGAVDRLGGNASPPKWKQYYNIQSALNGGLGWYILLAGWLDSPRRIAECRRCQRYQNFQSMPSRWTNRFRPSGRNRSPRTGFKEDR